MLNIFKKQSPVDKETLNQIFEETISNRLEKKNFMWDRNTIWFTDIKNSIRKVIKYQKLKGAQGTFSWGVCLDFVPTISQNKIKYHRTNKNLTLHLFEWTDEHADSFLREQSESVFTTHWGKNEAKKSITRLFDKYETRIFDWFETADTIENLITIAVRQIKTEKSYNLHSPNPKFVLAFLLAKSGQLEKAILTFEQISEYQDNKKLKMRIIQELAKTAE